VLRAMNRDSQIRLFTLSIARSGFESNFEVASFDIVHGFCSIVELEFC
jgi:hypothetical protein